MNVRKRLAIVTTHPIQYNAPWFRMLSERRHIQIRVFYTWSQVAKGKKFDPGFSKHIEWDIPLLDGYDYEFVNNTAKEPGSHHRKGIVNPDLNRMISAWKPDALLIFGWNFDSHWKCIRYFHRRIPIIFRGDSTFLRKQPTWRTLIRTLYLRRIYRKIDYALYVGRENYHYFRRCGLTERQLVYAPHAVDNGRFSEKGNFDQSEINRMKAVIGLNNNNLTILFAAKWEAVKNPTLFLEFATRFSRLNVNFIMAGNGPLDSTVRSYASANPNLLFIDFQNQSQMPLLYRSAHFFFMSSDSETWGLAVNEAMASSLGVIVRNTCACAADLVKDGENGFIFDSEHIDALVLKIAALVDRPDIWKKMGARSLELIEDFRFERIVDAIEGLFAQELSNTPTHA
jgi:glycosyltransferase involved in cell wall biosynthesis